MKQGHGEERDGESEMERARAGVEKIGSEKGWRVGRRGGGEKGSQMERWLQCERSEADAELCAAWASAYYSPRRRRRRRMPK